MSSTEALAGGEKPGECAGGGQQDEGKKLKTSWPEVVGMSIEEARKVILKDMPGAAVVAVPAGSPVTMDYRTDRVRIFVDTVSATPTVG